MRACLPFWLLVACIGMVAMITRRAAGEYGSCRYDDDSCSCKVGEANQGTCWDSNTTSAGMCTRRYCRAGWTCACGGRTHICSRSYRAVFKLSDEVGDSDKAYAACTSTSVALPSALALSLGSVEFHLSREGMLAGDCAQFAWWHNGELVGSYGGLANVLESTVDAELSARKDHSLLELRPGDLVAFRLLEASYYCYKDLIDLVVNGTSTSSVGIGFATHYARNYSKEWYLPSTELTSENMGENESESDLTKFLPLRTTKLSSSVAIIPGEDYWAAADDSNLDNVSGDWYFRMQLPFDI